MWRSSLSARTKFRHHWFTSFEGLHFHLLGALANFQGVSADMACPATGHTLRFAQAVGVFFSGNPKRRGGTAPRLTAQRREQLLEAGRKQLIAQEVRPSMEEDLSRRSN